MLKAIDIIQEYGGGVYSAIDNIIVVAPQAGEITVQPESEPWTNELVNQNTTSVLFHEIAERNEKNPTFRGNVIIYENQVRNLIGLPHRPFDIYHSNIIPTKTDNK